MTLGNRTKKARACFLPKLRNFFFSSLSQRCTHKPHGNLTYFLVATKKIDTFFARTSTMVARKHAEAIVTTQEVEDVEQPGDDADADDGITETIPLTPTHHHYPALETKRSEDLDDVDKTAATAAPIQKILHSPMVILLFQLSNIMAWYWTNGLNGISMQFYAGQVHDPSILSSAYIRFFSTAALTAVVTCLQLLFGALLGRLMLLGMNSSITWQQIMGTHWLPLSGLHALGSIATNLGFMYGKASLVQVIKLLEPFETLLLSQLLFQEGKCSMGIVSAMMLVVGAAMSLLKLQSTPPHPLSITFAILSGLTLSSRNVLQRKHHHTHQEGQWSKLDKSVVQFTQLSFFSGIWTGVFAVVLYLIVNPYFVPCNFQVLLWHPLYNVFSMITLGFCSALTHSLLNAGKRVFAICMAMLWFREGLNPATLAGLALVAVGGTWYSLESKNKELPPTPEYNKLVRSIVGLTLLIWFQHQQ